MALNITINTSMQTKDFVSMETTPSKEDVSRLSMEPHRKDEANLLHEALKDVIRELNREGITYKEIQERCNVHENAIKQFMFRKSKRPRITEVTTELLRAVTRFRDLGKARESISLKTACSFYDTAFSKDDRELKFQYFQFLRFIGNKSYNILNRGPSAMIADRLSSMQDDIRFFCYRKTTIPRLVQKSEFSFFRNSRVAEDGCFFAERYRPPKVNDIRQKHGIVRMTNGLISLFGFDDDQISTTHLRCDHLNKRAIGVSVSASGPKFACEFLVLVPAEKVKNKDVGPVDPDHDDAFAKELVDYKSGYRELTAMI